MVAHDAYTNPQEAIMKKLATFSPDALVLAFCLLLIPMLIALP